MLEPLDAKLLVARLRHGQPRLRKLNIGAVIHCLGQRFREVHAKARAGGIRLHLVLCDAKAVLADGIVQRHRRVVARLQGLRQTQRLHGIAAASHLLQRLPKGHQHRMLLRRALAAQVSVRRRLHRPITPHLRVLAVLRGRQQVQPRILGPAFGIVRHVQRGADIGRGAEIVAVRLGLAGAGLVILDREGAGDVQPAKRQGQRAGLIVLPRPEERQLGRPRCRPVGRARHSGHHLRREGALVERRLSWIGLEETGPRAAVEGQRGAAVVRQAGDLAGLDVRIQKVGDVAPRQVGIVDVDQPLGWDQVLRGGLGGGADE